MRGENPHIKSGKIAENMFTEIFDWRSELFPNIVNYSNNPEAKR